MTVLFPGEIIKLKVQKGTKDKATTPVTMKLIVRLLVSHGVWENTEAERRGCIVFGFWASYIYIFFFAFAFARIIFINKELNQSPYNALVSIYINGTVLQRSYRRHPTHIFRFALCYQVLEAYGHQLASCTVDIKSRSLGLQHECEGAVSRSGRWGMIELCRHWPWPREAPR